MGYQDKPHINQFEATVLGKKYIIYAYDEGHYIRYKACGPLFEEIHLIPIECDNPPCFAINGITINDLSKAFTNVIESHCL